MTTSASKADDPGPQETAAERAARLQREAALLQIGREDIHAGRILSGPALDARLEAFARGERRQCRVSK